MRILVAALVACLLCWPGYGQTPAPRPRPGLEAPRKITPDMQPPTVLYKKDPAYTNAARKAKVQGTVALSIVVGPDGVPTEIKPLSWKGGRTRRNKFTATGSMGLDKEAIKAVQSWRFQPARKEGRPVPVIATVEVNFRLL